MGEQRRYDPETADVHELHQMFRLPISEHVTLMTPDHAQKRIDFLREELQEFIDAVERNDIPKAVDGLIDLVYVAKGTAIMMGVNAGLWAELWAEVQRANISKERDPEGDDYHFGLRKPMGWIPPQIEKILAEWGA